MATDEVTGSQVEEAEAAGAEEEEESPKEALKKVIGVKVADAGVLRRTVTIIVPEESLSTELDKEYDELIEKAEVPGFRRGHAPRRLVEKRFGRDVDEQVQTRIVSNAYLAAIEKEDMKVLGDPLVWVRVKDKKAPDEEGREQLLSMDKALEHITLPEQGDFEFRCEVEVKPEFELPSLEGVLVERPDLKITDEDVQVQIDRLRAGRGSWVPVDEGGKVQADDLLVCDVTIRVDGKEIKTIDNLPLAARAQAIEGALIADLGERLAGAKLGDVRTAEGTLPDDHQVEAYRGKKAEFQLRVNEIKRMQLPPLDEAFLAAQGFDSEDEYRSWVREQMESRLEAEIRRGMRNQICKWLLDNTKLDLPEGLSSRQTERAVARRTLELQRRGLPQAEIDKRADALRTSTREETVAELKLYFILEAIAEKLDIEVSEEEINAQIAAMARAYNRRFDRVRDELFKNNGIESLYVQIRDEKCLERILDTAKITEAKVPKKGSAKPKKVASKSKKAKADEGTNQSKKASKVKTKTAGASAAATKTTAAKKQTARKKANKKTES